MTRTARRGPENKKRHEATDWETLKTQAQSVAQSNEQRKPKPKKGQEGIKKKGRTAEAEALHFYMHKEERREQRRQKRLKERLMKKVCFKCRLPGHKVEECLMNSSTEGTGICFKCGSTEHSISACKAKVSPGSMPFASCFVCGKQGHISRNCPDNPRGLYPRGGGCKTCGSVEHFQRDCPDYLEKQGIGSKQLSTVNLKASVDADDDIDTTPTTKPQSQQPAKKKLKVVKF